MEQVKNLSDEQIVLLGKDVDSKNFKLSWDKLMLHQFSDPKLAYNLSYINERIHSFIKEIFREHGKLIDKYATKNEDGTLKVESGNLVFPEDVKEQYKKDLESVHSIEKVIRKKKLSFETITQEGFKFTPVDMSVLSPLFCGFED